MQKTTLKYKSTKKEKQANPSILSTTVSCVIKVCYFMLAVE